jgi:hypothetical protein
MGYAFLADLIVALHVAYVGFVVVGQLAIVLGLALGWRWVRNPWFRVLHLVAIVIVGVEAAWGITCPLTRWENELRHLAGQPVAQGSFIGRLLHNLLFYNCDQWYFDVAHIGFALLVVATFILAPPRWRKRGDFSAATAAVRGPG